MDANKCRCGAPAYMHQRADQSGWRVACRECGLDGGERTTRQAAMTAWRWKLMQGANTMWTSELTQNYAP